jgi:hypothetical protein
MGADKEDSPRLKLNAAARAKIRGNARQREISLVQKRATSFVLSWTVGAMLSRFPPVRSRNRRHRESIGTAGDSMLSR